MSDRDALARAVASCVEQADEEVEGQLAKQYAETAEQPPGPRPPYAPPNDGHAQEVHEATQQFQRFDGAWWHKVTLEARRRCKKMSEADMDFVSFCTARLWLRARNANGVCIGERMSTLLPAMVEDMYHAPLSYVQRQAVRWLERVLNADVPTAPLATAQRAPLATAQGAPSVSVPRFLATYATCDPEHYADMYFDFRVLSPQQQEHALQMLPPRIQRKAQVLRRLWCARCVRDTPLFRIKCTKVFSLRTSYKVLERNLPYLEDIQPAEWRRSGWTAVKVEGIVRRVDAGPR